MRAPADPRAREILKEIEGISALPTIARRLMELLNDPQSSVDQICAVASIDPGLVTLLLRTVNSAYFGLHSRVTSVKHALVILGIEKFRHMALASAIFQKFRGAPKTGDQDFWEHAVRAAQWSKEIGRRLRMKDLDDLFIAGLVHNTGRAVMVQQFRAEWRAAEIAIRSGMPPLRAEKETFGWTHAQIGAWLFHLWKIPEAIVESALYHHHDPKSVRDNQNLRPSTLIVNAAAALGELDPRDVDYDAKVEKTFKKYAALLDMGEADAAKLSDAVQSACDSIREMIGIGG